MKPKHPKRLYFSKVSRPAPRPRWHLQLIDRAGTVLQQFAAAAVSVAAGLHRLSTALGRALAPVATYELQLQLPPAEVAWLRKLAG
jgi:negative regulator of sigma E activity